MSFFNNNSSSGLNTDLLNEMKRLQREYVKAIGNADEYRRLNKGAASQHECIFLQQAADKKSKLISISAGSGEQYMRHISDLEMVNQRIASLRAELEPKRPAAPHPAFPGAPAGSGNTSSSGEENKNELPTAKSQNDDDEIDTSGWYQTKPKNSFEDVSGMEDVKEKLKTCMIESELDRLAKRLKMSVLNSFFFVGPPGCGKTYIIKAFVNELMTQRNYNYLYLDCSQIITKYVGDSEKIVKKLFEEAVKAAPCILFIDEIDGMCKNRSLPSLPEYASSLTTAFLTSYNIINESDKEIIFIGATNYPRNVDEAMLDRVEVVYVGLPDREARIHAFADAFGAKSDDPFDFLIQFEEDLSAEYMADRTKGYNYRDIKRVVENVKKELFNDLATKLRKNLDKYTAEEFVDIIIDRLNNGTYKLKKSIFDEVLGNFIPSNKNKIIAEIKDWMDEIRSNDDSTGTSSFPNVQGHPDFEDPEEDSQDAPAASDEDEEDDPLAEELPDAPGSEEPEAEEEEESEPEYEDEAEEESAYEDEAEDLEESAPVEESAPELIKKAFLTDDQFTLAPDGTVTVSFRLTAPPVGDVFVMSGRTTYECTEEDGVYSAELAPGDAVSAVRLMIFDNDGLYDTADIRIVRGIAGNTDFDL